MSKHGRNTNKHRVSLSVAIPLIAACAVVGWLFIAILVGLITQGGSFQFLSALTSGISDYRVWVFFLSAIGGVCIVVALRAMQSSRRVLKINDIEDTHWMTNAEVQKSDNMTITSYSKLEEVADGMPVYAKKQGRDITVLFAKPIHTLVIGTTGSGKTTTFVDPTIQILSHTKSKPCIVLTDPKGEIYRHHAATLEAQGYKVLVLDVVDPYSSARWNPFAAVIEKTRQINEAEGAEINRFEVIQRNGKYIDADGIVHITYEQAEQANEALGLYKFGGKSYPTYEQAENARGVYIQNLKDEIFIDLQDIVYTICPITSQQEPVWEQGARNFIFALSIAMWEDLRDGGCDEEAFNLHTLYKNVSDYAKGDLSLLSEYLTAGRDEFSLASGLANTILTSEDRQLSSYLSTVNNYMVGFADSGIRRLTSGNDIDLNSFDEQPTALFIKIPDEKENRHFLATLFITQLYKVLVNKARNNFRRGETSDEELKRNVYVIMDEFGNMPKFQSIDKIITVGRSRHIYMLPIIQDYGQLDNKYGKELAGIIRSNCNIKIFIGSTDPNTIKEFSELCGKTKQRHVTFGDGSSFSSFNVNTSAESVPLIYPSELEHLNDPPRMGNAIVLAFGKNPIRSKYEPVFKRKKIYKPVDHVLENAIEPRIFDERAHYYNFASRSVWIAKSQEFLDQQNEQMRRIIAELTGNSTNETNIDEFESTNPFDPLEHTEERLLPLVLNIKAKVPEKIGVALESGLYDHNPDEMIEACDDALSYSKARGLRWTMAESAKLKNIVKQLTERAVARIPQFGEVL